MSKEYNFLLFKVKVDDGNKSISEQKLQVGIAGMTCHACEIKIERKFKQVAGITKVDVNARTGSATIHYQGESPSFKTLDSVISEYGYKVTGDTIIRRSRPSILQLIGLFAIVLLAGNILSRFGLLSPSVTMGANVSLWAVFMIGLVAASSSCVAVAGGLLLSSAVKFNERYCGTTRLSKMKPTFLFVLGRIIGYTVFGALIGFIGNALSPSPFFTGVITLLAALYMLFMGLETLGLAPAWLHKFIPRLPKGLAHRVMSLEQKEHRLTPALLGAGTFFLPCGFTQALQLYALSVGNPLQSALLLGMFSLGTAPVLLALGWVSGSLKGKWGQWFFKLSGAIVIILGLWNVQNGLTIMGYPLKLPNFERASTNLAGVIMEGDTQIIKMNVDWDGYTPDNFTIKRNIKTRWEVNLKSAGGCITALQAPSLGIRKLLTLGKNNFEFKPTKSGVISFSCSMGMYRGQINVIN